MPGSRPYSMDLRTEQTAVTRRRLLDAAVRLFTENGYTGTTVAGIARAAGISVQTVYNVVGGKPALLKAAYDETLDDGLQRSAHIRAMVTARTGRECLARYADVVRVLGERILPLLLALHAQAATGDVELCAFVDATEDERAAGTACVARHVSGKFGLREGLAEADAAAILWAFTSPDLTDRLVRRRDWGWARYRAWLATTTADALLGPDR